MRDAGAVRIEGLTRFRATLKRAGADMADMKAANQAAARTVAEAAAAGAPRRSGKLAGSLRPARQVARARVSSTVPYAGAIHWGWPRHNISANPFLTRAAEQTQPQWIRQYEQDLQRIADSVQGA